MKKDQGSRFNGAFDNPGQPHCAAAGINVKISGNTLVNSELVSYGQSVAKGESVDYGTTVTVYFKSNTGVADSPG